MKKSINAWSIPAEVGFEQLFSEISKAGFDGVELNMDAPDTSAHSLTMDTDSQTLATIRTLSKEFQLPVGSVSTSLYWKYNLGVTDPDIRKKGIALLHRQIELAEELGAEGILVVPGGISDDLPLSETRKIAAESIATAIDQINTAKIQIGLENVWNGFFMSPFDMRSFIDSFQNPYISAYFDIGNVVVSSSPHHWIEILAEKISKVHVKDFKRNNRIHSGEFVDLYCGDTDFTRAIKALQEVGYDSYVTAELDCPKTDAVKFYQATVNNLKKMIG